MRALLLLSLIGSLSAFAADPIPGEVDCNKGGDMDKVKKLVARAKDALLKDRQKVLDEIQDGSAHWKDGAFYIFVYEGGTNIAHGFNKGLKGKDLTNAKDKNGVQYVDSMVKLVKAKNEGCIKYLFPNPEKQGQADDKVSYVVKLDDKTWVGSGTYLIK